MILRYSPGDGPDCDYDWVHAWINGVTTKQRHPKGFMSFNGTCWELEVELAPDILATYGFSAGRGPRPERIVPWEVTPEGVLRGPLSPDTSAFDSAPELATQELDIAGRRCWYYQAPGARGTLSVLDGEKWTMLPGALHNAGLNFSVVGIPSHGVKDRQENLGWNEDFLARVEEGIGAIAGPHFLAGQSLGGLSALLGGQPGHLWNGTLAQSPSLWWRPDNKTSPADWRVPEWIPLEPGNLAHCQYGLLEPMMAKRVPALGLPHTHYTGGHDMAWWRVGVLDYLRSLELDG